MDRPKLTSRQQEFLKWTGGFIKTNERSPTLVEIGKHFKMKLQSVDNIVRPLIRKGYLKTQRKCPVRTLVVLDDAGNYLYPNQLPVIGKVAAGLPVLAVENRIGMVTLDDVFLRRGATFALLVQGESMIDAGILPGDTVIIKQQSIAETGRIVLALIDDEATIKRFYPQPNGSVKLNPENREFSEIVIDSGRCSVLGVVIGSYRVIEYKNKSVLVMPDER